MGVASSLDSSVRLRIALGVLLALGALGLSVAARLGSPGRAADATPVHDLDATRSETVGASGALLLDLDDDLSDDQRAALAQAIDDAVAPFDWPDGTLGVELSAAGRLYRLNIPESELADLRRSLSGQGAVESLEREHTLGLPVDPRAIDFTPNDASDSPEAPAPDTVAPARGAFRPNDPYYRHQWHLDQVQMPHAWLRTRGRGVVVAVIDTGVLYRDHERGRRAPDLAGTRFAPGWDFVDGDATPDDEHGHGTHVAGTIAQSTHNAIGVAGVAPDATIMPIRVLDARGAGRSGDIAAAIRWAADHGADVINMSLGGGLPSRAMASAIEYAHDKGVVVVAAAGNTGRGRVEYPAAYEHVIAVGAVRMDGTRAYYSSYGDALDLMAPGGDLRVDQNGDGMPDGVVQNTMVRGDPMQHDYLGFQGTSMAAPHVAGVVALLRAEGLRDPDAIERVLCESAREVGPNSDFGAGLLQADAALQRQGSSRSLGGASAASVALLTLYGGAARRRRKLALGPLAAAFGAFTFGGGLSAAFSWWPTTASVSAFSGPHAFALLGDVGALLGLTAALPLLAYAALAHVRRLSPWLSVLAFGVAGGLVFEALVPTVRLALLPELVAGPWLLANAAICAWLGWAAAQSDAR